MRIPDKLKAGDEIRVIAPASSFGIISKENREIALGRFREMGLKVTFGENIEDMDEFGSSSVEARIADLHAAFADPNVKMVLPVIGGFNSNQLLSQMDWELIRSNPKIFCGYSDITALQNAILAKTGLVTYSGPTYSSFAEKENFEYSLEHFRKGLFLEESFAAEASVEWSNDKWYIDQEARTMRLNDGYWLINEGEAEGRILGGNMCTFNLLHGTEYMPDLDGSILFLEEDEQSGEQTDVMFERDLQSIIHQPGFAGVKGIVIGRFPIATKVAREKLAKIIRSKKELDNIPVFANADFGHTEPRFTFPIGGTARISAGGGGCEIVITKH